MPRRRAHTAYRCGGFGKRRVSRCGSSTREGRAAEMAGMMGMSPVPPRVQSRRAFPRRTVRQCGLPAATAAPAVLAEGDHAGEARPQAHTLHQFPQHDAPRCADRGDRESAGPRRGVDDAALGEAEHRHGEISRSASRPGSRNRPGRSRRVWRPRTAPMHRRPGPHGHRSRRPPRSDVARPETRPYRADARRGARRHAPGGSIDRH